MFDTEEPKPPRSYLEWMIDSVGWPVAIVLIAAAIGAAVMIWLLYRRGREPARSVAILLLIPLPLLTGIVLLLGGAIVCLDEIATSEPMGDIIPWLSFTLNVGVLTAYAFVPVLLWGSTALVLLSHRSACDLPALPQEFGDG